MDREKLGQALVNAKKISKNNLKHALAMHDKIGGDFARLLVKLGYIVDEDLTATIAELEGIQAIDISQLVIPESLVRSIPREVIEKHNIMPIRKKDGQITLAMSDVNDFEAIEEVQFLTSCRVEPILASHEGIRRSIIQFYYGEQEQGELNLSDTASHSLETLLTSEGEKFRHLQRATIELLLEKGVISKDELLNKYKKIKES